MPGEKLSSAIAEKIACQDKQIKVCEEKVVSLERKVEDLHSELECQQQYSRRNNLRIFGIPLTKDEDTGNVVTKMLLFSLSDRSDGRRAGGVAIYLKNNIRYCQLNLPPNNSFEFLWIKLFIGEDVSKKGKSLVSGRDVSKKAKKDENENLIPPCRSIEEETICPFCLDSHEEDWIQCGKCKA
ncbi:hypothetical protein QE152_g11152 [Popillia japonica]|uniref:Uncharacterized protein n=1 Tax=Popillia japonica TaxID=7064 RepID=A0AAW1LT88_POPJA